jgi:hypothetical protein
MLIWDSAKPIPFHYLSSILLSSTFLNQKSDSMLWIEFSQHVAMGLDVVNSLLESIIKKSFDLFASYD